ncbi:MAG TPA: GGDEF domain-containing protein [Candidatus Acidoferrales bacterium]|nr:GGDEF domain-containing protein [Candidatus Acidoferrales bacterium]
MAALPATARPERAPAPAAVTPRERKGDARGPLEVPRTQDRRAASGCLWNACEALLVSGSDPEALPRALDALREVFGCDGVALHAIGPRGGLEPWCARGDWTTTAGDLRECLGVPLLAGRTRVGALDLRGRRGQRWRPDQHALVRTASGALGAALGARLELERLRRAPGRDAATGLPDTKAFHQRLIEEFTRAQRSGAPLAVVTLDLDHFGALLARYGRASADEVLGECALVLKLALREGDFLARLGGDRFGVLLPDCDLAPGRRLSERLRRSLEEHRFRRAGRLSCSAGVASTPRDGLDATELLAAAEQALGLAKKSGRRRTVTSGPAHTH